MCSALGQGVGGVSSVVFIDYGVCSIFSFCRIERCFVIMVVSIVVRFVFMCCFVRVSGFVLMCDVYRRVLLNMNRLFGLGVLLVMYFFI